MFKSVSQKSMIRILFLSAAFIFSRRLRSFCVESWIIEEFADTIITTWWNSAFGRP